MGMFSLCPQGPSSVYRAAGIGPSCVRGRTRSPESGSSSLRHARARLTQTRLGKDAGPGLAQVEAENHPDRAATVEVLMERWAEVVDHALTTRDTTAGYVRRTINPALGETTLRKLQHRVDILGSTRTCAVATFCVTGRPFVEHRRSDRHDCGKARYSEHRCKPMTPGAVRRIHAILSSVLDYAVSWGWIERNPAEYAHPPKLARRRAKPPEAEQVARLLNATWASDVELAMFLWLATTTGARRGELVGLRWTAVLLNAGLIRIEHNYVVRGGEQELKETKTDSDSGFRSIP